MTSHVMQMVHDTDPREDIYKQVGLNKKTGMIPGFALLKNEVLCGIYTRPEKTKGGIMLTQTTRAEDQYQGKAALVLAKGPTAFRSDSHYTFLPEQNADIGDWVTMWVSDGRKIKINGQLCRIVRDIDIIAKISAPDMVY